jgi:dienelactone hydrolase
MPEGDAWQLRTLDATPAFSYEEIRAPFNLSAGGRGATSRYELLFLEIPSVGDNAQENGLVTARYYRSSLEGPLPLVIVLPIWGTYTYPPRKISTFIQRHSRGRAHVLHVQGERYLVDWQGLGEAPDEESFLEIWRESVERQRVTVIDARRLLDWAEQQPEINGSRVGLVGFSFAATVAGTLLSQDPRPAAAVLAMGGSLQHHFLAHCSGPRLTAVREKVARDFGWNAEDLERRLEPITRVMDAATGEVDPEKTLIIEAARDDCMPEASRRELWESLGRPERLEMHYDHRKAFYSLTPLGRNWMRYRIWEFLESRLLDEDRGPAHAIIPVA